jgi:non-ribosomal peptide synthase protein (TIGR01720 family)
VSKSKTHNSVDGVAIIGLSGRFPGANNIDEFWQNLRDGVETISFFSDEELKASGVDSALLDGPGYVKAHGAIEGIEWFDASFFGVNPREAGIMDPQHRLFQECAWEALEGAGYNPEKYEGAIAVYAGVGVPTYAMVNVFSNPDLRQSLGALQTSIRNRTDHLATQVSYKLNLRGPGVTVQTACSTSLVAVHLACQSLLGGECDIALAGGVTIAVPQKAGYLYQEGGILSPDGHCRAFDARAQGTVPGSGAGVVVLKRVGDALADGDCIYAVIRGSAINNDGSMKVGYTAPGVDGQAQVIAEAMAVADVEPGTISYIEAHGTGTNLGDPIEIEALARAFRDGADKKGFCAIGTVKSNIGHLDTAAGVAGLIKTVLALRHKQIPPSLHYEQPNPRIDFENSPFYVNTRLSEWKRGETPRRAGVSSFGLGGTNAHIVLEEAPDVPDVHALSAEPYVLDSGGGRSWRALLLSARTNSALENATAQLAEYLQGDPDTNLADVAYTLQVGRKAFGRRRAVICRNGDAAVSLETLDPKRVYTGVQEARERPVVFMFPGQGAQYVNMGLDLYQVEPIFREHVARCCELLKPHLGFDLRDVLYPSQDPPSEDWSGQDWPSQNWRGQDWIEEAAEILKQTWITQPVLFVVEYALARLWMEWGVHPRAMIGHSVGEYVAACLAGVLSLEDALALVAARGRLMQSLPEGAMLAVPLSEPDIQPLLTRRLSLAAVNGMATCVVSGPTDDVVELERRLTERGLGCRRLHTSHAFHSQMMDPILDPFAEEVKKIKLSPPKIPYLSNVTGSWIRAEEATDPNYWARHLRQTVRFADGARELVKEPDWVLLEVGPGKTLMTLVRWHPERAAGQITLTSLPPAPSLQAQEAAQRIQRSFPEESDENVDSAFMLKTLGRLWIAGVDMDWATYYSNEQRRRVPLPTYPFERQRYWVEPKTQAYGGVHTQTALLKKPNVADWFYVPSWRRSAPHSPVEAIEMADREAPWLLFVDECGLGNQMTRRLEQLGQDVICVEMGKEFSEGGDGAYMINPRQGADYQGLLQALHARKKLPRKIVHLWGIAQDVEPERALNHGFHSLLLLAQAIGAEKITDQLQIEIVTNNMQEVVGGETLYPEKAAAIGACRAISQEYQNIACRSIDIALPGSALTDNGGWPKERLVDQLISEVAAGPKPSEIVIAYRGHHRWSQTFEPMSLRGSAERWMRLQTGGVYLITGGMGGIGLELAEHLARAARARLILTGRSAFPERENWDQWLAAHDEQDAVSYKIRKLRSIENLGAEVLVLSADVTDKERMREVIERFGPINGVIHSAGVAGGGMIQLKTPEAAAGVLAPKVQGTRVLEEILKDQKMDFLVLCSSRSSILGGFGQADYCAANAVLDAFAHYHNASSETFTVSINWAGWQEVGMRADTLAQLGVKTNQQPSTVKEIGHPLLARCIEETPESKTYSTQFGVSTHWVLDDHRIMRQPVIPGTTYLEMIRAALERHADGRTPELRDVFFLSALPVREDEIREVRAVIEKNGEKNGDEFEFRVLSKMQSGGDETWQEFVIGKARLTEPEPPKRHDIKALIEKCNVREVIITDDNPIVTYEDLGPRWQSLKQVFIGHNELVAMLELPEAFAADVETYKLHPALLDKANFTAKVFLAAEGLHLPMSYRGLRIKRPLPSKIYAYARYKPNGDPLFETITFDVILMDEDGLELVEIDEFSQKRVREVAESIKAIGIQEARRKFATRNGASPHLSANGGTSSDVREILNEGMSLREGVEAFSRILAYNTSPQVVVSPNDLMAVIEQSQAVREMRLTEDLGNQDVARPRHARPDVQTDYLAPRTELERTLAEIWQETLGIEQVGIHDNFFELGGDSVVGIQMTARFKRAGYQLSPLQLFQNQTIAELALALGSTLPVEIEQGVVTGLVPLTPSQRWFFEQNMPEPQYFNQAMLLDVREGIDTILLETAVRKLLEHHDALRLRFEPTESGWTQTNTGIDETIPLMRIDLSQTPVSKRESAIRTQAAELQASLDLSSGPLVRFAFVEKKEFGVPPSDGEVIGSQNPAEAGTPNRLLIVAHNLVIDSVSWGILLSDLDTAYQQLAQSGGGEPILLPPKTSSFKQWAEHLAEYAQSDALRQEADYWLLESRRRVAPLPVDRFSGANTEASVNVVSVSLEAEETQALLHEAPQAYHAAVNDLLLTAVAQAFARWTGNGSLLIEIEDHGREAVVGGLDLSHTVGVFSAAYPIILELAEGGGPMEAVGESLKAIKEQLRRVPAGGVGYGLLRYLSGNGEIAERLRSLPQAEVRFSYLGQFDLVLPESSPFAPSRRTIGALRSPRRDRSHLLEISGATHRGRLRLDWTYSENLHCRATIERLAQDFVEALRQLIAHCQSPEVGGYTPSDFPLANVSQRQLDGLIARFSKTRTSVR